MFVMQVANYNELLKKDLMFKNFIRIRSDNPFLENHGVMDRWSSIFQRFMKYPLKIERMIYHTHDDPVERKNLETSLECIKVI